MPFQFRSGVACLAIQFSPHICRNLLFTLCYLAWFPPWILFLITIYKYLFSINIWRGVQSDFSQILQSSTDGRKYNHSAQSSADHRRWLSERVCLLGGFFNGDGSRVRKIKVINIFGLSSYLRNYMKVVA